MLIGLSSSTRGAPSTLSMLSASIADGAAETSSASAVSAEGVTPKPAGKNDDPADCGGSFQSLSIRLIRTAIANVITAAQAATAPISAYKRPVLVGKRSMLS